LRNVDPGGSGVGRRADVSSPPRRDQDHRPRADFIVDAALVSRLHCRISATDDTLEVVDLSSTNGTFVNDRRVQTARLGAGDRLRVGRVELRVARA
jgi:pSer/pThr/pTyr-binding forkhead associated (FHA) protein